MLLAIHIAAGGLAIVLGAMALVVKKGGIVHRRSGVLFAGAMLLMGITAAMLGIRTGAIGNVFAGLMTRAEHVDPPDEQFVDLLVCPAELVAGLFQQGFLEGEVRQRVVDHLFDHQRHSRLVGLPKTNSTTTNARFSVTPMRKARL